MIQFNLLPDVKVEYLKSRQLKRTITVVSIITSVAAVVVLLMSVGYSASRRLHLNNLNNDIVAAKNSLQSEEELNKILSVQNQLNKLPELYAGRPAVDRLPKYIVQTTPIGVNVNKLRVDFDNKVIEVAVSAKSLEPLNTYIDTLKFTNFITDEEGAVQKQAFTTVAVGSISSAAGEGSSLSITIGFDPDLFNISKKVTLIIPDKVTTYEKDPESAEIFTEGQ